MYICECWPAGTGLTCMSIVRLFSSILFFSFVVFLGAGVGGLVLPDIIGRPVMEVCGYGRIETVARADWIVHVSGHSVVSRNQIACDLL